MYRDKLRDGHTLEVFSGEELVFSSSGRWLHPLFQLDEFIRKNNTDPHQLSLHDSITGIAAAAICVYLGIGHVHSDLMSEGAAAMFSNNGVDFSYGHLTERIKCITETMISPGDPPSESYIKLRKKANLTSGMRLEVRDIVFSYDGRRRLLDGVSFILNPGDTVILKGENGSGKTTLLRIILSLLRPDSGTVLFDGKPVLHDTAYIKQRIASDSFPITAGEVVSLAVPKGKDIKAETELAMRRTGSFDLRDRDYFSLSGGEAEKVDLARALASEPRLLILDEPAASLDRASRDSFASLLSSLAFSEMPTILLVSHDPYIDQALGWPELRLQDGRIL